MQHIADPSHRGVMSLWHYPGGGPGNADKGRCHWIDGSPTPTGSHEEAALNAPFRAPGSDMRGTRGTSIRRKEDSTRTPHPHTCPACGGSWIHDFIDCCEPPPYECDYCVNTQRRKWQGEPAATGRLPEGNI